MLTHYEDMKGDENAKIGVFWGVRCHPRPSETSPFDRAHTTSYSTLIETMRLSCTVIDRVIARFSSKVTNLTDPTCICRPRGAIIRRCLRDPTFSRFDTIPECDKQTHRHTDTRRRQIPRLA